MTIDDIRRANAYAGKFFFSPGALRFFASRIGRTVYEGPGGLYFVTSEQFIASSHGRRGHHRPIQHLHAGSRYQTRAAARREGGAVSLRPHPVADFLVALVVGGLLLLAKLLLG